MAIKRWMLFAGIAVLVALGATGWHLWSGMDREGSSGGGAWGRDYFPNVQLIDQDGRKVRFFDDLIEGKVVLVNFIFTSCGDSCPLETARLRQVQRLLGDQVGKTVHFYSISIDPIHDTPEVLKRYAEKFNIGPGWQFLTGDLDDITHLRRRIGLLEAEDDPGKLNEHSLSVMIGNQSTGQWMKVSPFENPYILADKLANTLQNWKVASKGDLNYEHAPKLRTPSNGEQLFRTRCSTCHTLGPAEGMPTAFPGIGPDLLGVTRVRERAWLVRWIQQPDRMLAEKDPLAMKLFQQYNQMPMPNLRLGDVETDALLEYIEAETRRQRPGDATGQAKVSDAK